MAFISITDINNVSYKINPRTVVSFYKYTKSSKEHLQLKTINNTIFTVTENINQIIADLDGYIKPGKQIYTYKGQVATLNDLYNITGMSAGDVYNVIETNSNYAWNGSSWDNLGGTYTLQPATATSLGGIKIGKSLQVQSDGTTDKKTYVHEQTIPLSEWTVEHNLNSYPNVHIIDSNNNECICEIVYTSSNSLKIKANKPFKGIAYLN